MSGSTAVSHSEALLTNIDFNRDLLSNPGHCNSANQLINRIENVTHLLSSVK